MVQSHNFYRIDYVIITMWRKFVLYVVRFFTSRIQLAEMLGSLGGVVRESVFIFLWLGMLSLKRLEVKLVKILEMKNILIGRNTQVMALFITG